MTGLLGKCRVVIGSLKLVKSLLDMTAASPLADGAMQELCLRYETKELFGRHMCEANSAVTEVGGLAAYALAMLTHRCCSDLLSSKLHSAAHRQWLAPGTNQAERVQKARRLTLLQTGQ